MKGGGRGEGGECEGRRENAEVEALQRKKIETKIKKDKE